VLRENYFLFVNFVKIGEVKTTLYFPTVIIQNGVNVV